MLFGGITANGLKTAFDSISSLGSMLSPAIGAGLSYKASKNLMGKQQAWLEHMSNTAYQRQVKDLVAAGINPLYGLSSGASTPSSGLASAPDYASAFSMGNRDRLAVSANKAQVANMEANSRLADANTVKTGYEADYTFKELENYDTRFAAQLDLLGAQAEAALQAGSASSAQASYYKSLELGQNLTNVGLAASRQNEADYFEWLKNHPFARWRSYNDRAGLIPGFNFSGGSSSGPGYSGSHGSFGFHR